MALLLFKLDGLVGEVRLLDVFDDIPGGVGVTLAHLGIFLINVFSVACEDRDACGGCEPLLEQIVAQLVGIVLAAVEKSRFAVEICRVDLLDVCEANGGVVEGCRKAKHKDFRWFVG